MIVNIEERENVQQMTINGIPQTNVQKFCELICPNCKMILNQVSEPKVNLIKALSRPENQGIKYCPNCSTKLDYPIIIDCESRVISNE